METLPRLKSRDQTRLAHWLPLQLRETSNSCQNW